MTSQVDSASPVRGNGKFDAVVIGASAGGIAALTTVLSALPADYPAPIMVVVHIPPDSNSLLVEVFAPLCRMRVKEAEDKESLVGGTVYFAPPNYHLLVEKGGYLSLSSDEPVLYSRPSIDVLFESASDAYGERIIGIVLTGANTDGANGIAVICKRGGVALVQDPQTAEAPPMPVGAIASCPSAQILSLKSIAEQLVKLVSIP